MWEMIETVAKNTSINLRITPEFRAELEELAEYHGLKLSSMAHSLLVKAVRQSKSELPEAFNSSTKPSLIETKDRLVRHTEEVEENNERKQKAS